MFLISIGKGLSFEGYGFLGVDFSAQVFPFCRKGRGRCLSSFGKSSFGNARFSSSAKLNWSIFKPAG
ncbi:MAG: hypothetical protein D6805_05420 [Planctomycetota bacterium]|nr:MAG: hypothetical protein D6805_05420 [Planctomycetota bacterium]